MDVTRQVSGVVAAVEASGRPGAGLTVCCAVAVQPFAGLVTVKVYVPAVLTAGLADVELKPPGPLQLNVAPDVDELPLRLPLGAAQVRLIVLPAAASGGVVLTFSVCCAVAVQPLEGLVTVTVYVPAVVTAGVADVELKPPGPLQLYVAPPVVELTLRFAVGALQVIFCVAPVVAVGGVLFNVTVCCAVAGQLGFEGSVTVRV